MAAPDARSFEDFDAIERCARTPKGLLIGITGPQFSGKSYSAGRLAVGIQRVYGGAIYWVDTENDRALELTPYFKFRHVPFSQPKEPREYEGVVRYCLDKPDCGVIILDQCTHEHVALLDMRDDFLDQKAGDDWKRREQLAAAALVRPKAQRKRFEELVAYGAARKDGQKVPMILLYRATDKSVPGKSKKEGGDGGWLHKGWQAETTSTLPYYMTARFLLPPGSDGRPNLTPDTEWEKLSIRNPQQFRDWFKPGFQLNEEIGERLARWAKGEPAAAPAPPAAPKPAVAPRSPAPDQKKLSALAEALSTLQRLPTKEARGLAMALHFGGATGWSGVKALDLAAIVAGTASLARELDGLAAMRADHEPASLFDNPRAEREPGEDNEEVSHDQPA